MSLVEDCTLRLDDPVDDLPPELADMTLLADPTGPLDDTVAAARPITLRDLLTNTLGTGMVPAEPGTVPIADAMDVLYKQQSPDEWIRRLGSLPLVHQPGERWMYDTAASVTGVLIARATGMSFGDALRERICGPLGMKDTAFSVGGESIRRLATAYQRDNAPTGGPVVDDAPDGRWSRPPVFESGGGGIVSTAEDCPHADRRPVAAGVEIARTLRRVDSPVRDRRCGAAWRGPGEYLWVRWRCGGHDGVDGSAA